MEKHRDSPFDDKRSTDKMHTERNVSTQKASTPEEFASIQSTKESLLSAMKIFGLYHEPSSQNRVVEFYTGNIKSVKILKPFNTAYCTIVTVFSLLNLLRIILSFFISPDDRKNTDLDVFRVIVSGWYLNCFLNTIILYVACHKAGRLHGFFEYLNKISSDHIARKFGIKTNCPLFRRKMVIHTVIAVVFSLFNAASVMYMILTDMDGWLSKATIHPLPIHPASSVIICVITLYCSAAWIVPVVFVVTMSSALQYRMKTLRSNFEKMIEKDCLNAASHVNDYRVKHLQYTKAIGLLDRDFQYLFAEIYMTGLLMSCFILYQLINSKELGSFHMAMYIVWLSCNLLIVLVSSVAAAYVNEEAHSPQDLIYDLDIAKATVHELGNVNMFLSKLSGPAIGFTTMGLLTITKELILSLAGLYVTYFFILFQFKV